MKKLRTIRFEKYVDRGIYNYDLVFYDRIIDNKWEGLRKTENWDKVYREVFSKKNYYVTPATGEDIVLLPAIAWFVVKSCRCCVMASSECESAIDWIKRDPEFYSRWFYAIDSQFEAKPPKVTKGVFEKKDCVFWRLEKSDDLFDLQAAGIGDVATGLNVLAGNDIDQEVVSALLGTKNIDINKILEEMELFVATTYGFDMGFYNGVTIKSPVCIDEKIVELEVEFKNRISEYNYLMSSCGTVDEWISAIRMLAIGTR